MKAGGASSSGSDRPLVAAGYTLMSLICMLNASSLVFSQVANSAASFGCFEVLVTAMAEPPQMPVVVSPAFQAGSGAAAHLPAVSAAMFGNCAGAQEALIQPARVPSFISAFH